MGIKRFGCPTMDHSNFWPASHNQYLEAIPAQDTNKQGMIALRDVLLLLCLSLGVLAAPHSRLLSTNSQFLEDNLEFSLKITLEVDELRDIMCKDHKLCNEEELTIIKKQLGLHSAPLEHCDAVNFNKERCFSQLTGGLKDFLTLLTSAGHLPQDKLDRLYMDIKDLLANIQTEMESQGFYDAIESAQVAPVFSTEFHEKAGTFLILSDLHAFMLAVQNAIGYPFNG
uniref:Colony stimulating factor 3 n=1 Tax=Leptobrachium leishanense TaxID=445787 RepID=A0A8C5QRZ2_9ANUR